MAVSPLRRTFAAMKRAIVIGASSGIGRQVAQLLIQDGWHVGMAARRIDILKKLQQIAPDRVYIKQIDVNQPTASAQLLELISELGGLNLYFHAAGIGYQNRDLDEDKELRTVETNALGFARMVGAAFRYFGSHAGGHIAVVSSIAGTKGLGPAPAYSATKALQNTYLQALEQLSHQRHLHIRFTDIRPGFVDTPLLFPENNVVYSTTPSPTTQHPSPNTASVSVGSPDGVPTTHHPSPNYPILLSSRYVAKRIIKAVYRKKRVVVIDWRWRLITALWRRVPNCVWKHIRL